MLSVVVDDFDMGVTHVIRGDDHLNNAARQMMVIEAMGWPVPVYAHIPLIHGPDGAKLSKRHGALAVEAYRDMGYLPEAMRNYLLRLGWSHGDEEIISTAQAVSWFDLDAVGRSAARFDFAKLGNLNGHYIRARDDDGLAAQFIDFLPHAEGGPELKAKIDESMMAKLLRAMPGLKERAKTLVELKTGAQFLFAERPLPMDEKAAQIIRDGGKEVLAGIIPVLEQVESWLAQDIEAAVKAHAEAQGLKLGKVAQPLRAALTGTSTSPGIFDVLDVLGREESLARLRDQCA